MRDKVDLPSRADRVSPTREETEMQKRRLYPFIAVIAIFAFASIAAGCGDDNGGSSSSSTPSSSSSDSGGSGGSGGSSADSSTRVNDAIQSCKDKAASLGGIAATALQGACTSVGAAAIQAANAGGARADQALITAANSCDTTLAQVPNADAKDALQELCDAIRAAGSG
jgi:hypothetical protein